ncbi:MAG: hypothetical protein JWO47_991 [Candidatus Saccharibacteria bacterium]|nr:hypothetical protein [Candidatus Saccharibacteria bacterium]
MLYKQIQKITKIKIIIGMAVVLWLLITPSFAYAAATCPDGSAAAPGTACSDGTYPVGDPTLPIRCPGGPAGPEPAAYKTNCPTRPGRSACTYTEATMKCISSSGTDVSHGDAYAANGGPVVSSDTDPASNVSISEPNAKTNDCTGAAINRDNCGIVKYLAFFINILSAVVGIVVTGVIIWGGIEYSTSGGDPAKVQAAKKKIYNGVFSLIAFIFTYAFLQYIIPGGVL